MTGIVYFIRRLKAALVHARMSYCYTCPKTVWLLSVYLIQTVVLGYAIRVFYKNFLRVS